MELHSFQNNITVLCRLCLRNVQTEESVSIINNPQVVERIKECVTLEVGIIHINQEFDETHKFPSNVCKKCVERLNEWVKFKTICLKTDLLLKRDIKTKNSNVEEKVHINTTTTNQGDTGGDTNTDIKVESCSRNNNNRITRSRNILAQKYREIRPKPIQIQSNIVLRNPILPTNFIETCRTENKHVELETNTDIINDSKTILSHAVDLKIEDDLSLQGSSDESAENKYDIKEETLDFWGQSSVEIQDITYTCEVCTKEFSTFIEYLDHQDDHRGEPVFICEKCSEVFSSKEDLAKHEANHKVPCDLCGLLVLKQSMKHHKIRHTDRFKCLQCPYKFSCQVFLDKHIIAVHAKIKTQVCELCGKSFATSNNLRIHLQSHGERTYKCKYCDYAGKTSSSLLIHTSKHLKETHVCESCSKVFKSYRNLYDHLRRVHKAEKKHVCTWKHCQMKFIDKYMLRTHMRIHTGNRPYSCTKCDKTFIRSDSLKEHFQTHDRTVFFECNGCAKKFTTKRGKTRHKCIGTTSS